MRLPDAEVQSERSSIYPKSSPDEIPTARDEFRQYAMAPTVRDAKRACRTVSDSVACDREGARSGSVVSEHNRTLVDSSRSSRAAPSSEDVGSEASDMSRES